MESTTGALNGENTEGGVNKPILISIFLDHPPLHRLDVEGLGWMLNAFKVFVALDRWAPPGAKLDKEVVKWSPLLAHSTVTLVGGDL